MLGVVLRRDQWPAGYAGAALLAAAWWVRDVRAPPPRGAVRAALARLG